MRTLALARQQAEGRRGADQRRDGQEYDQHRRRIFNPEDSAQGLAGEPAEADPDRCPDDRRGDIGDLERDVSHPHHAGDQRDHGADRAEEAADEDADAAPAVEEVAAGAQQLRVAGERPDPLHPVLQPHPDPVGDGVAQDGAGDRPGDDVPRAQRARLDQRAGGDQDGGGRQQQAEHGEGFAEGEGQNDRPGPAGMGTDRGDRLVDEALHAPNLSRSFAPRIGGKSGDQRARMRSGASEKTPATPMSNSALARSASFTV